MTINKYLQSTVDDIKSAGFRVFIAESGNYGFYTDKQGSRIVSFQIDSGCITFSGNYRAGVNARGIGTGWRIQDAHKKTFATMFDETPPYWATNGQPVTMTTLNKELAVYGESSRYTEV